MKKHFGYLIAFMIFATDRFSKFWTVEVINLEKNGPVDLLPFLDLNLVWNRGVSLGLFQMDGDIGRYVLIALTGAVTLFVAWWLFRAHEKLVKISLGLILGGAVGNIWDRFEYGAVADFFHFFIGDWSFYTFNVADAAITIGVVLLLWDALLLSKKKNT
jgi:signal peptidase II